MGAGIISFSVADASRDIAATTALPKFDSLRLNGETSERPDDTLASFPSLVATFGNRWSRGARTRGEGRHQALLEVAKPLSTPVVPASLLSSHVRAHGACSARGVMQRWPRQARGVFGVSLNQTLP